MSPNVRHPAWLPVAPPPGVHTFAALFFVETLARASLASVLPIQALDLLGSKSDVNFLYAAVAVTALGFGLSVPVLIRLMRRRWVYTLGALLLVAGAVLLATGTIPGQAAGMTLRVMGAAALNITTNLYMLDYIAKRDYVRNDATRLGFSTFGWTLGPAGGVWLYTHAGPWAAFGASAAAALVLLGLFWYYRLSDNQAIRPAAGATDNPLRNFRRFVAQPRLRLAWAIAFCRSAFWSTFFIQGPILMVSAGAGQQAGGLLVSAGNALLISIFLWGRVAARIGIRAIAGLAFLATAASLAGAAACLLAADLLGPAAPWVCAALLLLGAFFVVPLDAVGGVPFYRAVRPRERAEMTSVYRSYLDLSDLLPPLLYGLLLLVFDLGAVFFALAFLMAFAGWLSLRYIPRSLA